MPCAVSFYCCYCTLFWGPPQGQPPAGTNSSSTCLPLSLKHPSRILLPLKHPFHILLLFPLLEVKTDPKTRNLWFYNDHTLTWCQGLTLAPWGPVEKALDLEAGIECHPWLCC